MENYFYTLQQMVHDDLKRDTSAIPRMVNDDLKRDTSAVPQPIETSLAYTTVVFGHSVQVFETHKKDVDRFEVTYISNSEIYGVGNTLEEASMYFAYHLGIFSGKEIQAAETSYKIQKLKKKINKLKKAKKKW